jgi:hypothetical protein
LSLFISPVSTKRWIFGHQKGTPNRLANTVDVLYDIMRVLKLVLVIMGADSTVERVAKILG